MRRRATRLRGDFAKFPALPARNKATSARGESTARAYSTRRNIPRDALVKRDAVKPSSSSNVNTDRSAAASRAQRPRGALRFGRGARRRRGALRRPQGGLARALSSSRVEDRHDALRRLRGARPGPRLYRDRDDGAVRRPRGLNLARRSSLPLARKTRCIIYVPRSSPTTDFTGHDGWRDSHL